MIGVHVCVCDAVQHPNAPPFLLLCIFSCSRKIHKHIVKQVNKNLLHHNKRTHSHHSFVHVSLLVFFGSARLYRCCCRFQHFRFQEICRIHTRTHTHERSQHAYVFDDTNNDHTFNKSQNVYASFKSLSRT